MRPRRLTPVSFGCLIKRLRRPSRKEDRLERPERERSRAMRPATVGQAQPPINPVFPPRSVNTERRWRWSVPGLPAYGGGVKTLSHHGSLAKRTLSRKPTGASEGSIARKTERSIQCVGCKAHWLSRGGWLRRERQDRRECRRLLGPGVLRPHGRELETYALLQRVHQRELPFRLGTY